MPSARLRLVAGVVASVLGAALVITPAGAGETGGDGGGTGASLRWRHCGGGDQCARLAVPVDDTKSGGPTLDLTLVRVRAREPRHRVGSLLVNPGGPGFSGVDYVRDTASMLPAEIRDRFDIVGFDPRGVGRSRGVDCTDDLDPYYDLEFAPSDEAERAALVEAHVRLVEACERENGDMLRYITTERAARDLDRIRAALGEEKLTYLGYSYGTFLGAWYAEQFPERVRALVLDGAVDPAADGAAKQVGQSVGFERALDLFLADCTRDEDCAFHSNGDPAGAYDRLRSRVGEKPIRADDAGDGRRLNGTTFDLGVLTLLYGGRSEWSLLGDALALAADGDGSDLLYYSDLYTGRDAAGDYDDTIEAFLAISCADGPSVGDLEQLRAIEEQAAEEAPRLGRFVVNVTLACALWPVEPPAPRALSAEGAAPILVLGTRNDPATPIAGAKALADQLDSGVLVEVGGARHTAFAGGNNCVDRLVVRYLVDRAVPTNGSRC